MISEAKCAVVTLPYCPSSLSPSILPDTYFNIVINPIINAIFIISNTYVANAITTITELFFPYRKKTPDTYFNIVISSIVISSSTLKSSPLFGYFAFLGQHLLHRDNL